MDELGIDGPVAAITAGWQDREMEDGELREHLGNRTVNLIYRRRLRHAMAAAHELLVELEESEFLDDARREAIGAIRELDTRHLDAARRIHRRFRRELRPDRRAGLRRQRAELAEALEDCEALAIAGGHVAVLLNRLRLFDVLTLAGTRPILAWSAGAMALGERVVVFHDSPPQGAGDAEVLEVGLGHLPGLLPFPHARRRLRLGDPHRVSLLARRFAPSICVALDEGDRLVRSENGWTARTSARRLTRSGEVRTLAGPFEATD
jgi:hypothetical protein